VQVTSRRGPAPGSSDLRISPAPWARSAASERRPANAPSILRFFDSPGAAAFVDTRAA
jgi:hypothetical protein